MDFHFDQLYMIEDSTKWKRVYEKEIKKLDQLYQEEINLLYGMYGRGKQSPRLKEIQNIKLEIMADQELKKLLEKWKKRFKSDYVWHRRLEVFLSKMEQEELDNDTELMEIQRDLQSSLMQHTFVVKGKEYNMGTVHSNLMENPDQEIRQLLFKETKKIADKAEPSFRKLIERRNQLARQKGYENYHHFRFKLKEIDFKHYCQELNAVLEAARESSNYWNKRIKEKFGWETIHYYDQLYTTFNFFEIDRSKFTADRMEEVLHQVVDSLGLNSSKLPVTIECLEIPYGGFCLNVNQNDIRVVVNKRDTYSAFLTGIHELGHALDAHYNSYQYPDLYRFRSIIAAEGISELFQTIPSDRKFLMNNFDLSDETYSQIEELTHLTNLNMVKLNYYSSLVEHELYTNPERDYQDITNEFYQFVFGFEGETPNPANDMIYIELPIYVQDYNYALATRDMIRHKFNITSPYGKKEVFNEVKEKYIKPIELYSWHERVNRLCNEPHTFKYLAEELAKTPQAKV